MRSLNLVRLVPFTHSTTDGGVGQVVPVHLQPHALADEPERVEQLAVLLGAKHGADGVRRHVTGQGLEEQRFVGHLTGQQVGGVVEVGRYLHGDLALRREQVPPTSEDGSVVGHPVQRGVGQDHVVGPVSRRMGEVAGLEAERTRGAGRRLGQHRR